MRSGTLSCNLTVGKKTFLRFWPLWALYTVIWLIVLPLQGLMQLQLDARAIPGVTDGYLGFFARNAVPEMWAAALPMAVLFGVLAAMAVCSHLYSARSANFMGALPARREGLFLSHYLSGLAMLILPTVLTFVLTLLIEAVGGAVYMPQLLFWLGYTCVVNFFFYSFAVCIGMFAGHLLALPIFYGIFNGLVVAVYSMLQWVMGAFYYGFTSFSSLADSAVEWVTPVWKLSEVGFDVEGQSVSNGHALAVYTAAAVVLAAAALLLYRRRQLETAGDVVAVRAMKPVFKYGVALCSGLFLGYVTALALSTAELGLMVSILLWGVAGYFAAQMLLDKSFRVLRRWKGAVAVAAVFLALFAVVGFDLTGFETRVPQAEDVSSVAVKGLNSVPYDSASYVNVTVDDEETIALLTALHRLAVDQRGEADGPGTYCSANIRLTYTLNNGSTLSRRYNVYYEPWEENLEGTTAWVLTQLLSDREFLWLAYDFDRGLDIQANGGALTSASYQYGEKSYYGQDAQELLDAVIRDFEAGRIGAHALNDGAAWEEPETLEFSWETASAPEEREYYQVGIALTDTATDTLAVLERLNRE